MASLTDVTGGNTANASDIQQVIDLLKGAAGKGVPAALTALSDAVNFALAVKNNDSSASKAFVVYKSDGTVLLQADKNGVSIPTLTGATLTAPHMTGPVVDSGNLTITSGNLLFGTSNAVINGGPTSLNFNNNASNQTNLTITDGGGVSLPRSNLTITAGSLIFSAGSGIIQGGTANLSFNNNASNATNMQIADGGGVSIPRGGINVTGNSAFVGTLSVSALTTLSGGVTVAGAVATMQAGLTVSAGVATFSTGLTVPTGTTSNIGGNVNIGTTTTTPLSFYGHGGANQAAATAAATDLATVIALANSIRTALQGNGLMG